MKSKNTLFLLLLAVGIFTFIYLYERNQPSSGEIKGREGQVLDFDRDKITRISLKTSDSKIEMEKKDGAWYLDKPVKDRADAMAIVELFTDAERLRADSVIPNEKQKDGKDLLKEYGLNSPETRIAFLGGERPVELLFGKDAAVEGKVYVRLDDSKTIYVVSNKLKNHLAKKPDEFRDHKLTDLLTTQVSKVSIKTASGSIDLQKNDQDWTMTRPIKARANGPKIVDLVAQAANARVESFVADSSNLASFGLQEPRGSIALSSEGRKEPVVLQIGQPTEKDKARVYVKLSTRDSVLVVPHAVEGLLDVKPNDVRDPKLLRVDSNIVDRITIEPKGGAKIVLARKAESWVRKVGNKEEPVNVGAAGRLLQALQAQEVVDFVSDIATELPKYGLDQPAVKVTLSAYSSEPTAESNAGEKPIVAVLLAKGEGNKVFAKLDDEPFVVSLLPDILEFAMTDPLQWQEQLVYQNKADDISALEITREGQPTITLERDKEKKWALVKGDGQVNQRNVESMVNTLANLKAVYWIGATAPEHGLEQPRISVSFKTSAGPGKLVIGIETPDHLYYASAEGKTGTFVISTPDFTAFQLPFIEAPAAAVPAGPAPTNIPTPPPPAVPAPASPAPPGNQ